MTFLLIILQKLGNHIFNDWLFFIRKTMCKVLFCNYWDFFYKSRVSLYIHQTLLIYDYLLRYHSAIVSKVLISHYLFFINVDKVLIDHLILKVSIFINLNFWLLHWLFLSHFINNCLDVVRDSHGLNRNFLKKLRGEFITLCWELLNKLNSYLDLLINLINLSDSWCAINACIMVFSLTLNKNHLLLKPFILLLELQLVFKDQLYLFKAHDGVLQSHLDGAGRVPAVVDHHVHEQFTPVQLFFQRQQVHLRVVGYDS